MEKLSALFNFVIRDIKLTGVNFEDSETVVFAWNGDYTVGASDLDLHVLDLSFIDV